MGGGLLGCTLAWRLAASDTDVLLLERDQINQHASGRNAGSLHFQLEHRMISEGLEAARRAAEAIPLHLEAAEAWQQFGTELGPEVGVEQHGGLMLANDTAGARLLEQKAELERSWGLDVEILDRDQVHQRAPYLDEGVLAATYCPSEGKANARTATPAICREAIRRGAAVWAGAEVRQLRRDGTRWLVDVDTPESHHSRQFEADAVVLAAGVWCNELAASFDASVPVGPVALTMAVTARNDRFIPHLVQHADRKLSLKQTGEGNVLIGGGWPALLARQANGEVDLRGKHQILADALVGNMRAASASVPRVRDLSVLRTWVGTTTLAADQLPVVGAIPGAPGAFVATGGSAFTLGPIFAELLAELIEGQRPHLDLAPYAPNRFATGNADLIPSRGPHD